MKVIKFPDDNIKVHGIPWFYDEGESKGKLWRLPQELKTKVYEGLWDTAGELAGIRLRFRTDSTMLRMKVNYPSSLLWPTSAFLASFAIELYVDGLFWNLMYPLSEYAYDMDEYVKRKNPGDGGFGVVDSVLFKNVEKQMREIELYLPKSTCVDVLYIGIDDDAELLPPVYTYALKDPVYFYGDSIMHGASSRPGMLYPAIIGRMLNVDVFNLGYSGCGKGEMPVAEELADRDASCYVLGYGGNIRDAKIMEERYYPFLKIIKDKKPDVPVLLLSQLGRSQELWDEELKKRSRDANCKVVRDCYERCLAEGMKEIYFEDVFFYEQDTDYTVDTVHLSDKGSQYVAELLAPVIKKILKIQGDCNEINKISK